MAYQVLARKYRPQNFDDVIGQEHITSLIKKAIQAGRVHHAYLFCGPRGIGKTTCARILAMCLNGDQAPGVSPDLNSPAVKEIMKGSSLDVIEIDGASNRGIDEIRALRENIKFAPSYGRFKIYIVDEVHMLTTEAFNALLKTLEEPPAHVKFIFATTEPNKVPATIISRCQRFDFKRISITQTVETLRRVAQEEKLKVDDEALYAIAKSAQGSLRDALSVLDQMSALSERGINAGDVYSMLGLVETQYLFDISERIAHKDCAGALLLLEDVLDRGKDIKQLTKDLCEHFRNLMVIKVGGKTLSKLVDYPALQKDMLLEQCQRLSLKDILTAIDTFIVAQETSRITETQRMPLELALARLTYRGDIPVEEALAVNSRETIPPGRSAGTVKESRRPSEKEQVHKSGSGTASPAKDQAPQAKSQESVVDLQEAPVFDVEKINRLWDKLTHSVSKERMSVATFLQDGKPMGIRENVIVIGFAQKHRFQKENLETKDNILLVERVFSEVLRSPFHIKYEIIDDFKPKEEEPAVRSILDEFGGQVVNRWHHDS